MDADPSTGTTDSSAVVYGTSPFNLGINVTQAGTPYKAYQVELEFPNAALDFGGTTAPTAGSPFQLCQAANNVFSGDASTEFVQDGCAKSTIGNVSYTGQVETMALKCNQLGTFTIHLRTLAQDPAFGSSTLDAVGTPITTLTQDATVTCAPSDADGDGCPTAREIGTGDPHTGAQRDPQNPWDFFDVPRPIAADPNPNTPRDHAIGLPDAIAILAYVGTHVGDAGSPNANGVTYDSTKDGDWFNLSTGMMGADGIIGPEDAVGREFDRTASADASKPWQTQAPNGVVSLGDVLIELNSIGTNCN